MANYQRISERIEELIIDNPRTEHSLTWVNVVNAGKNEINYLRKSFNFDLLHLKAAAASSSSQRPVIYRSNNYICLILHFPVFLEDRIVPMEIDFFFGHGFLVSVHNGNKILNDFFASSKKSPDSLLSYSLESSAILLYEILKNMMDNTFRLLDENSLKINHIEDMIFRRRQKEVVSEVLNMRRNIVNIRRIVQNHKNIFQKLLEMESTLVEKNEIKKYYAGLIEHSKLVWENLDNQKELVEVLNSTNESLLNDNMANIMKTLTIFSVIVFPLNLIAAIFGMNAKYMPIVDSVNGFWIILFIMTGGSLLMLLFFEKKK